MRHIPILAICAVGLVVQSALAADARQPAPQAKSAAGNANGSAVPAVRPPPSAADTVDQKRVHSEYGDGDFETVVQILEDYRARHDHFRVTDSVVIAKYLGVIYAANPDTREKGKYWLYRMLQIDPGQDLVDLYVGEEVQTVFERVRQEFIVRRNYRGINDTRLNHAIAAGEPPKRDTVVRKDTVILKGDNYLSPIVTPITEGIKGGYDEVKGGIKAGIQAGYVPVKDEALPDDNGLTGDINVGAGLKFLESRWQDLAGFTDETGFNLTADLRRRKWPINIALDFAYAFAPEAYQDFTGSGNGLAKQTIRTYELCAGVRKIFDFRLYSVRPFFGGGLGYVYTEWDLKGDTYRSESGSGATGIWLNGGVYWELDRHFNIGIDWMYSWAKITFYTEALNNGGQHLNMLLGYHF
jgi:opacity protein-like surface antigen